MRRPRQATKTKEHGNWEEGCFTAETNKEAEEGWKDSGGRSNEPREARKRAMPSWLKDFVMTR